MDESTAQAIGRAFVRVLARLRGKPAAALRVGLGRDMRLTAPAMAAELRDGMIFEGATVLDAGMVATEMLYHLVGSRQLDGGAMVTASHNPKAYTGVKLVREGALPLSGDAGIGDVRAEIEAGLGHAPGGGSLEEVDIWDEYRAHALSFVDPTKVKPMKVVVDGGNGMAGPMVGPILAKLGARPRGDVLRAQRRVPRPRAEPAAGEEPADDHGAGARERRRPRHRLGRRRRPLLLHRRQRRVLRRRLRLRPAGPRGPAQEPRARRSSTTRAPAAPSPTWSSPRAAARISPGSATPSSRRGCARRAPSSAARSPAITTSATSGTPTRERSRRC